jgi:hypothetical protein
MGEIQALLKAETKTIPVILPTADGDLKILGHQEGPYVAISHVWADGSEFPHLLEILLLSLEPLIGMMDFQNQCTG